MLEANLKKFYQLWTVTKLSARKYSKRKPEDGLSLVIDFQSHEIVLVFYIVLDLSPRAAKCKCGIKKKK